MRVHVHASILIDMDSLAPFPPIVSNCYMEGVIVLVILVPPFMLVPRKISINEAEIKSVKKDPTNRRLPRSKNPVHSSDFSGLPDRIPLFGAALLLDSPLA